MNNLIIAFLIGSVIATTLVYLCTYGMCVKISTNHTKLTRSLIKEPLIVQKLCGLINISFILSLVLYGHTL